MLRFSSLGSGSRGNATLVHYRETYVVIDCGFSLREIKRRLNARGVDVAELSAVLVTHEHADHGKGALALSRAANCPLFTTHGTARALDCLQEASIIDGHTNFSIGDLWVEPVIVPHDAAEPVQYVFAAAQKRIGLLTDLGMLTPHIVSSYQACDALLLEFNHDTELLRCGPYPAHLQRRVGGDWGHLNNLQAANLLSQVSLQQLQHLVISHVSEKNNQLERVWQALQSVGIEGLNITVSSQDEGHDWLRLE